MSTKSSVCNCFTNLSNLLFIVLFYFVSCCSGLVREGDTLQAEQLKQGFLLYVSFYFVSLILSVFYLIFSVLTASDADEVERHPPVLVKPVSGSSQDDVKHKSWD